MSQRRFLIVHPDTRGNAHDAGVLGAALQRAFSGASVTFLHLTGEFYHDYQRPVGPRCPRPPKGGFDAIFMIELAWLNPPFFDPGFAKRFVYVPHIEWMNAKDEASLSLGLFDMVLAKNDLTQSIFSSLPVAAKVRDVPVTGWTSRDVGLGDDPWDEGRFNRFLHVRGISQNKQTDVVVETWRKHPEWPPLLVTAYVNDPFSFDHPLSYGPNIDVIVRKQSDEEIVEQARAHGVHVIPSLSESFGHVLNEARAVGAILLTTDAQPMNNLVEEGRTGFLVAADPKDAVPHFRSHAYPVTEAALEAAVGKVLNLSLSGRAEIGKAARAAYEADHAAFDRAIAGLEI